MSGERGLTLVQEGRIEALIRREELHGDKIARDTAEALYAALSEAKQAAELREIAQAALDLCESINQCHGCMDYSDDRAKHDELTARLHRKDKLDKARPRCEACGEPMQFDGMGQPQVSGNPDSNPWYCLCEFSEARKDNPDD